MQSCFDESLQALPFREKTVGGIYPLTVFLLKEGKLCVSKIDCSKNLLK